MGKQRVNSWMCFGLGVGAVLWSWVCFAQEQDAADVFGSVEKGSQPTAPVQPTSTAAKSAVASVESDRFVLEVRETNPTTAEELVDAIRLLATYGRIDEAQNYAAKLVALNLGPDQLLALHRKFGSGLFFRWGRDSVMGDQMGALARQVLDTAKGYATDPARLETLIKQLSNPKVELRRQALSDLRTAGTAAFAPLLKALADPGRADEHKYLRGAMSLMGTSMIEPLAAALDSKDESFRTQVVETLGRINDPSVIQYLVFDAVSPTASQRARSAAIAAIERITNTRPSPAEAEYYLRSRAQKYFAGKIVIDTDEEELATVWRWNEAEKSLSSVQVVGSDASLIQAGRLAANLYSLRPDRAEYRRLHLTAKLEAAKVIGGVDQPVPRGPGTDFDEAAKFGMAAIEDTLTHAVSMERFLAATACVEVLGSIGTIELLQSKTGEPRALARALSSSNRRLRFAAAEAILEIDPGEPFAGSSRLPETLGFFFSNLGDRRALIAHPRTDQAQTLAGMLTELGIRADSATNGRRAFQLAISRSDYEFILLSDALESPQVEDVIGSLRADPKTSELPIGIMAREERYAQMEQFASREKNVVAMPRSTEMATLAREAARLAALVGRNAVGRDERVSQAQRALEHFARLGQNVGRYSFYDLLRHEPEVAIALDTPELTEAACRTMGQLGTARAQRALLGIVNQDGLNAEVRKVAVNGLTAAIELRGIMLTRDEIVRQYDQYNSSRFSTPENQQILAAALDAIELPYRRRLAGRTRASSEPQPDIEPNSSAAVAK